MPATITEQQVRGLLRRAIEEAGSQSAFARKHGIPKSYVSMMASGQRPMTEGLLAILGVRRVVETRTVYKQL